MPKSFRTGFSIALTVFLSCSDEAINLTCPDPLGADAQTKRTYALSCFQPGFDGCFEFRQEGSSLVIQSIYVPNPHPDPSEAPLIRDIGAVTCLSEVKHQPDDGWQYKVKAEKKHGYVFKMKDGSLGRLFIDSWQTSEGGVHVNFTRQYPY